MTRNSCIAHPPRGRFLTIRQEYIDICKGFQYPLCAAAVLHVFEHWTDHKLDQLETEQREIKNAAKQGRTQKARETRWIFLSQDDLKSYELFGLFGETTVARSLKELIKRKFIKTRRNPTKKWDRTMQYWFEIETVQKEIDAVMSESQPDTIPCQHDMETVPARHGNRASTTAIPQDSSQDSKTDIASDDARTVPGPETSQVETTFDDLPGYMETRAIHGPVLNARQELEDAIYRAFSWDPKKVTKSEKGKVDAAVRDLYPKGYRAENIPIIYAYCVRHFKMFGPNALASNASAAMAEQSNIIRQPTLFTPPQSAALTEDERLENARIMREAKAAKEGAS